MVRFSNVFSAEPVAKRVKHHVEPINDDGTYRTSVFYNTLNTSYVATALKAARAADPSAKLYINEYNLEYAGAKFNTFLGLVKQLLADGVPLDGVGFQGHLIVGSVPGAIATQLSAFTTLGLEVAITELDIRMTLPATAALYQQQKTDYQTVIKACKSVPKCVGVTIWDYTDKVRVALVTSSVSDADTHTVFMGAEHVLRPGCSVALGCQLCEEASIRRDCCRLLYVELCVSSISLYWYIGVKSFV
jgi:hypothetical protein